MEDTFTFAHTDCLKKKPAGESDEKLRLTFGFMHDKIYCVESLIFKSEVALNGVDGSMKLHPPLAYFELASDLLRVEVTKPRTSSAVLKSMTLIRFFPRIASSKVCFS